MHVLENLLNPEEVAAFRTKLERSSWLDGRSTAMGMASTVKHNAQADGNDPQIRELTNRLLGRMGETPTLMSAALPQHIFPPCFNRYAIEQEYGFHVDGAIMRIPGTQAVMRSDLSMTLFLSQPDEYEGGELVIATGFGEQIIKLKAGDAVLYPSSSLHKVTAVTKGVRYAAITWMQSMISDSNIRQTLFQLDKTIQTLSDNPSINRKELDNLHNVYHNLIRQFSQV
jgi:PKHD-type hydroxylase